MADVVVTAQSAGYIYKIECDPNVMNSYDTRIVFNTF